MKYFVFFVVLNLFVCLAYSQESCEQDFGITTPCTPCQQALHKYNVKDTPKSQLPEDKCLIAPTLSFHAGKEGKSLTATSSVNDIKKIVGEVIDKTCDDTEDCKESYAVAAYKEVDAACSEEITKGASSVRIRAENTIVTYYTAIPTRGFLCSKEGGDCVDKWVEQIGSASTADPFKNPTCDDCSKRIVGRFLRWQEEHPLDTPSLQEIFAPYIKKVQEFEKTCPIPDNFKVESEGQRLTSSINAYLGAGIVGLAYVAFM